MFREMRRKEKGLPEEEMLEILKNADYGVLSTVGEDGYPYGVPLNFSYCDGKIYFHSAQAGHKVDNLANCGKASFCVVCDVENMASEFNTKFRSVIAFGKVSEVTSEGSEKSELLATLIEKYSKDYYDAGMKYIKEAVGATRVYQMTVEHMTAKGKK